MVNSQLLLRLILSAVALCSAVQAETIVIDANAQRHPIDPRVYGVAFASPTQLGDLNCPLNRQGGNATSRYNWQLNASNRGMDWYFESIAENSATAGESSDTFITQSKNAGAQPMVTIPMIGWVAKLGANRGKLASFSIAKYGAQTDADWNYFPDAGNGIKASNGQFVTGNDPNDANVPADSTFQQNWVQHIVTKFGTSANGGLRYYVLDNEYSIWHSTHRDVKPTGATMTEIRDKMVDYATKIKAVDPGALVVGPEEWGWSGYLLSGYDQQWGSTHGWSNLPDKTANGNMDYLPWLLDQIRQRSTTAGKRLLDIFTVHYYPQGGEYSDDTSSAMQSRRNRSTRSLWDPNYVDETWIGTQVKLIPRLKGWVSQYYPGTQIGVTEYNWGAEGHINGATAQADVFGIFGREGLDCAARWTTPDATTPTYKAMKMYRNYDGQKSGFGETSISTTVTNPDNLSAFSAIRAFDGSMTVMIVNKVASSSAVTANLNNFSGASPVQVWQLTSSNAITKLANLTLSGSSVSLTVPAQSITLLVIPPQTTGNRSPVITTAAAANPNPASTGQNVAFSVAASDPDSDALTYSWNFGDGSTGTGANPSHAYTAAGTFTATATVSDGRGGSVSSSVSVTVQAPANRAPTMTKAAAAVPNPANTGQSVALSVTASDPDGDPLSYAWTFGDGATGTGASVSHTYGTAGTFTAKATVSDGRGGSVSSSVTVTVQTPANRAPTITKAAAASPNPATTGQSVAFSVTASDPDSDPLSYAWTFGDGSSGAGASASHTFSSVGTYTAKATVSDGRGGSVSSSVTVTVQAPANKPPAITSPASASPTSANVGQAITFTVAASDPEGAALSYVWSFGDDLSGTGASLTHAYSAAGTYTASVVISDGVSSVSFSVTVTITSAPPPPPPPPPAGTGLTGEYFDNIDLTNLKMTRVDPAVNFNWGKWAPPGVGRDTFSVRWTGQIVPSKSETYTFYTISDDGVRLWVNNQLLINNWTNHSATENKGTIALQANTAYAIKLEYYDKSGSAVAKLSWSSASIAKQIVPQSVLYPNAGAFAAAALSADGAIDLGTVTAGKALRVKVPLPEPCMGYKKTAWSMIEPSVMGAAKLSKGRITGVIATPGTYEFTVGLAATCAMKDDTGANVSASESGAQKYRLTVVPAP